MAKQPPKKTNLPKTTGKQITSEGLSSKVEQPKVQHLPKPKKVKVPQSTVTSTTKRPRVSTSKQTATSKPKKATVSKTSKASDIPTPNQTSDLTPQQVANLEPSVVPTNVSESEIPTQDIIGTIKGYINSLPDTRAFYKRRVGMFYKDFSDDKQQLISAIDDAVIEYGEDEYTRYLITKENEIATYIYVITHDSDDDDVHTALTRLYALLSTVPLTRSQLESISNYEENIQGFDEVE